MGKKRNRNEYSETTNRKVFNIIHITCVTGCCLNCAKRARRNWYHLSEFEGKRRGKFPSWKLVSKNRKQWQEKPLKLKEPSGWYQTISW